MAGKPQDTKAQLGFLVLAAMCGIGAVGVGFFALLAVQDEIIPIALRVLGALSILIGFVTWIVAMHLLHTDLRKRWNR